MRRKRTPFAWRNITHRRLRAVVALSGIAFSVLLIFMQLGFWSSVLDSGVAIYDRMDADIILSSPQYIFLGQPFTIPIERLELARSVDGVQSVRPFYAETLLWRNLQSGRRHPAFVMGMNPDDRILDLPVDPEWIRDNGNVAVDTQTRPHYGPLSPGTRAEIGSQTILVTGNYSAGTGFASDGAAIMSDETFVRAMPGRHIRDVSLGVVRIDPGRSADDVANEIRSSVPEDTLVMTRKEVIARELRYWTTQNSLGPVFGSGAAIGFGIGMLILYQVLSTDIANHLKEYATLKALGYPDRLIGRVVLQEVTILGVAGFAIGLLLSLGLYHFVRSTTKLPMNVAAGDTAAVFFMTMLMCLAAGLLSIRKLRLADPADLF